MFHVNNDEEKYILRATEIYPEYLVGTGTFSYHLTTWWSLLGALLRIWRWK